MTGAILWTAEEVAAATKGTVCGDWAATGVSIDSRTVEPGDLFVAIVGDRLDGHDFVVDALAKGAAAAMVHRPPQGVAHDAPLIAVRDTTEALRDLGQVARLRSGARFVAVTGSVGKTGTKEALRLALETQGPTYATVGNLNNHWGVPLSLSRLPRDAAFGVFELGMNHAGEIAPLSRLVRPDVAIITTVAPVHIENLGSIEAIADAKAEIFQGQGPEGIAILNRDNAQFARLAAHARTQGVGRVLSFGESADADARLVDCSLHATASAVSASILGDQIQYSISAPGRHWVMNSLAVLLTVKVLGADVASAARALARIRPLKGRGLRSRIRLVRGGSAGQPVGAMLLIDESYNASAPSVTAALSVLGRTDVGEGGRRIAVLGEMLELGPHAEAEHLSLAPEIAANDVDLVFACGSNMKLLFDALPERCRGAWTPDSAGLAPIVADAVRPGDAVVVKGSLGSRMALIVEALEALDVGARGDSPAIRLANGL